MGSAYVRYASICSAVDWNSWNNSKRWPGVSMNRSAGMQSCASTRASCLTLKHACCNCQRFELFQLFQSTALQIEAYRTYAEPIERFHFRARHSGRQLRHPDEAGAQASQRLKQIALLGT